MWSVSACGPPCVGRTFAGASSSERESMAGVSAAELRSRFMLAVRVLGPMRVELDGAPLAAPASRRAWSLLAYLALHPGPHRRADLAARFWPDVLDASARQSLRSATWALRRALGPAARQLVTSRDEIALEGEVWADCREFAQLVDAGRVDEALALGEGELLAGFDDEWAHRARAAHRERLGEVLEARATAAER